MKNLLTIVLICSCNYLWAQNLSPVAIEESKMDAYLTGRKPATLTIQIKNLPDSVKKVNIKYTLVQFGSSFQATKYAETDAAGSSKITLGQNLPYQQLWLSVGDYLYAGVYVNAGLTVTVNAAKPPKYRAFMISDGITYSGYDGELNTVMNKSRLFRKGEKEKLSNSLNILCASRKKYTSGSFMFKTDSILQQLKNIDTAFISKYPGYGWAVRNETLSDFYENICIAYWNDTIPQQFFDKLNAHHPFFTSNDGVLYFNYLAAYTLNKRNFKKGAALADTLNLFDRLYTQQRSDLLKLSLLQSKKDDYKRSYPLIINSIKIHWCKRIASDELINVNANQKRIDSLFALSKKLDGSGLGVPLLRLPFNADLYQLDSVASIDDFIQALKSTYPGKALIIDFWATWCVPCLADLPYSKSLHEKNADLPVEYIYLCTTSGSNINLWKNRIGDMQIPGIHIFVNDKIIAKLKTAFSAEGGFPAYVLININGKISPGKITSMQALDRDSLKKAIER